MNSKHFKYNIFLLLMCSIGLVTSCDKNDDLEPNQAKGKIIAVTGGCYGEVVLIEVDDPNGIGLSGTFSELGKVDEAITYQNAIAIPYFSKIGIEDTVPQTIGTELYFEYRELTEDEREQSLLFSPNPPPICTANIGPPPAKSFIITKIINFK